MPAVLAPSAPTLELERQLVARGHALVAGVDEVGRGSWAGPVVAAAVVLPLGNPGAMSRLDEVRDSKTLTAGERHALLPIIASVATAIGVGWASHHVIDRVGIAAANRRALLRAVEHLPARPDALLIDYFTLPECPLPQLCVPKGDSRSLSVAAASIVAKVVRDRWMARCDSRVPGYEFASNKGYGTAAHRAAISKLGLSPLHRRSYRIGCEAEL